MARRPEFWKTDDDLSNAEKKFLRYAVAGETYRIGSEVPRECGDENAVHAELIRWMALGGDHEHRCHKKGIDIVGAYIKGSLNLEETDVSCALSLHRCMFPHAINLLGASLRGLYLDGSHLAAKGRSLWADRLATRGGVHLRKGFEAIGGVRLLGARIGGALVFSGGTFRGEPINYGEERNAIECDNAVVDGGLFFRNIKEIGGAVDLSGMQVQQLSDDVASWPLDKLHLDGFRYDRINGPCGAVSRIGWLERQCENHLNDDFKPQPYEQLARVLRDMGHVDDARAIAIAKEERLRKAGKIAGILRPLHWLYGAVVGYGYRPIRAAIWSVGFVAFGVFFFQAAYSGQVMVPGAPVIIRDDSWLVCQADQRPTDCWKEKTAVGQDYPKFFAIMYALDTFVPLIDLGQERAWTPNVDEDRPLGYWAQIYWWIHILAGWVIASLLAVTVGAAIRRTH